MYMTASSSLEVIVAMRNFRAAGIMNTMSLARSDRGSAFFEVPPSTEKLSYVLPLSVSWRKRHRLVDTTPGSMTTAGLFALTEVCPQLLQPVLHCSPQWAHLVLLGV